MQQSTTHRITLQHIATHCNTLNDEGDKPFFPNHLPVEELTNNTLQLTSIHASRCNSSPVSCRSSSVNKPINNALQKTAPHFNSSAICWKSFSVNEPSHSLAKVPHPCGTTATHTWWWWLICYHFWRNNVVNASGTLSSFLTWLHSVNGVVRVVVFWQVMKTWKYSCRSSVIMRSYPPQYPRSSAPLNPSPPFFSPPFLFLFPLFPLFPLFFPSFLPLHLIFFVSSFLLFISLVFYMCIFVCMCVRSWPLIPRTVTTIRSICVGQLITSSI